MTTEPAVPGPLDGFIAGLPKAELHVHHVGSASPRIVAELAARHEDSPVPKDPELVSRYFTFTDFAHFVDVYLSVVDLVRTPEDVRMLTYEIARDMVETQSIRYAELTCSPYTSVIRGIDAEAFCDAIEDARHAAERDFGIVLRWCFDIPGESGIPAADETLRIATEVRPEGLVSFGLGGPEIGVPRAQFKPHFDAAPRGRAAVGAARRRDDGSGDHLGRVATARRRADRSRHVGDPGPRAGPTPRRGRHPARGVPDLEHRDARRRDARRAPDQADVRRGDRGHGQLRRPTDVRHHSEPRVRRGARMLDLDERGLADLARTAVEVSFADAATKARIADEIDSYARRPPPPNPPPTGQVCRADWSGMPCRLVRYAVPTGQVCRADWSGMPCRLVRYAVPTGQVCRVEAVGRACRDPTELISGRPRRSADKSARPSAEKSARRSAENAGPDDAHDLSPLSIDAAGFAGGVEAIRQQYEHHLLPR